MILMELSFCFMFLMWIFKYNYYIMTNYILLMIIYFIMDMGEGFYFSWDDDLGYFMSNFSFSLILLSIWIVFLMIYTMKFTGLSGNMLFMSVLILMYIIIKCFMSSDLFMFYFFFEASLIPTFFLVLKWGHNKNSIISAYYMLFYTVFFSLPLLIMLFYLMEDLNNLMFELIDSVYLMNIQIIFILLSLLVKLPVFILHVWLPKAHVEAPVFGSMILAALMLKLGGYGLLMVMMMFFMDLWLEEILVVYLCIMSIYLSILCLNQIDLKMLVAYSSIVHMGVMSMGLFMYNFLGVLGAQMLMVAHGLCSSGLFYMVYLFYLRTNSRMMIMNKGLLSKSYKMMLMWFLLCSSNFSAPLSLNLVSELFLLNSFISWSIMLIVPIMFMCFFSVIYSIYLFIYISHNKGYWKGIFNDKLSEYYVILMHWIPLNLMMFNLLIF